MRAVGGPIVSVPTVVPITPRLTERGLLRDLLERQPALVYPPPALHENLSVTTLRVGRQRGSERGRGSTTEEVCDPTTTIPVFCRPPREPGEVGVKRPQCRNDGGRSRDRTCDFSLVRAALSQLSYPPAR